MIMTSQETTVDKAELVAKAKALGYTKAHIAGVDRLMKEIAEREGALAAAAAPVTEETPVEAAAPAPVRKKAPRMSVKSINRDQGSRMIEKLDAEQPEYKHVLQPKEVTAEELEAKGLEATGQTAGNEIICRTDKGSFDDWNNEINAEHLRMMQSIDPDGERIQSHEINPKKGK